MKNLLLRTVLTITIFLTLVISSNAQLRVLAPDGDVCVGCTIPCQKLQVQGNIVANSYTVCSDEKTKENITNFKKGLNEIMELNPINYNYKENYTDNPNETRTGVMAQELQKIAPELVYKRVYTDSNEISEEVLTINPDGIIFILVNAVKELKGEIEELKSQLETKNTIESNQTTTTVKDAL